MRERARSRYTSRSYTKRCPNLNQGIPVACRMLGVIGLGLAAALGLGFVWGRGKLHIVASLLGERQWGTEGHMRLDA